MLTTEVHLHFLPVAARAIRMLESYIRQVSCCRKVLETLPIAQQIKKRKWGRLSLYQAFVQRPDDRFNKHRHFFFQFRAFQAEKVGKNLTWTSVLQSDKRSEMHIFPHCTSIFDPVQRCNFRWSCSISCPIQFITPMHQSCPSHRCLWPSRLIKDVE